MTQDHAIEKLKEAADCDQNVAAGLRRPIVLIGMMGAGKSRTGHSLAARIGIPFIDSDREIETAAGCSIADYFERYGEEAFRDGESRVLTRLLDTVPKVISAGGGIVLRPENRKLLQEKAITIWLQADIAVLAARCAGNAKRPLLQAGDPLEILRDIFARREAFYREASSFTVNSGHEDVEDTVRELLDALALFLQTKDVS